MIRAHIRAQQVAAAQAAYSGTTTSPADDDDNDDSSACTSRDRKWGGKAGQGEATRGSGKL
jgi:hypothetical protein